MLQIEILLIRRAVDLTSELKCIQALLQLYGYRTYSENSFLKLKRNCKTLVRFWETDTSISSFNEIKQPPLLGPDVLQLHRSLKLFFFFPPSDTPKELPWWCDYRSYDPVPPYTRIHRNCVEGKRKPVKGRHDVMCDLCLCKTSEMTSNECRDEPENPRLLTLTRPDHPTYMVNCSWTKPRTLQKGTTEHL